MAKTTLILQFETLSKMIMSPKTTLFLLPQMVERRKFKSNKIELLKMKWDFRGTFNKKTANKKRYVIDT
ncbi:MAG: hypothetical protein QM564_02955 [Bergeyella sp.]